MSALNTLVSNVDAEVYFALIPDKSDLYASMLPLTRRTIAKKTSSTIATASPTPQTWICTQLWTDTRMNTSSIAQTTTGPASAPTTV